MTTSLKVAEVFGRLHRDVLKAIDSLDCSEEFLERNFALSSYKPERASRNVPMTTSLKVAEVFGKTHFNVMESIKALDCSSEFIELNFQVSSYKPEGAKRSYPMYLMTRDGFTFLAMSDAGATGFTGARAASSVIIWNYSKVTNRYF
jgi:Rha family phage regulatory protein